MMSKITVYLLSILIYVILVGLLYLYDNYVGFLMNIIFTGMITSVLIISLIAEKIQKSKVSQLYYWSLAGCVTAGIFCMILLKYSIE